MNGGVYVITAPSGNQYVGSSANMPRRRSKHWLMLRTGTHHCQGLQAAWNKYGEALSFTVLLVCSRENLLFYEQRAIDILKPKYNAAKIAGTRAGVKWSDEARARMKANRNRPEMAVKYRMAALRRGPMPMETRAKISASLNKPETKRKLREAHIGKIPSKETRAKLSQSHMGNVGFSGRKHSLETRKKMSYIHRQRRRWFPSVEINVTGGGV